MSQEGFCLQEGTYGAEVTRHAIGTILQRGASIGSIVGGIIAPGDLAVTAGSTLHVKVAAGEAWITGTSVATQGGYYFRNTASAEQAFAAANATNPRIETIIAQVKDHSYAGLENTFTVGVVEGTATAGATLANKNGAGAVPASSLVLAYVLIPANAVTVEAGNIENVVVGVTPIAPVAPISRGKSFTAVAGEYAECTASITATLPTSAAGDMIGFTCGNSSATTFTVKAGVGAKIFGDFVAEAGASEVKLAFRQHVLLIAQSSTVWNIVAGEPKREGAYAAKVLTKAEGETGAEPSATRPAIVVFTAKSESTGGSMRLTVTIAGSTIGESFVTGKAATIEVNATASVTILTIPGETWKATMEASTGTPKLQVQTRLL